VGDGARGLGILSSAKIIPERVRSISEEGDGRIDPLKKIPLLCSGRWPPSLIRRNRVLQAFRIYIHTYIHIVNKIRLILAINS
jgi:hypothetical protein